MFRFLMLAVTALGGGVAFGRRALDRAVEKRVDAAVEIAQKDAASELEMRIRDMVRARLFFLAINLIVKAATIGAAYLLHAMGQLTADGFRIIAFALLAVFLIRDIVINAPFIAPALRYARAAGWSPRGAVRTFVVGVIFERAYAEALVATERGPNRLWLALSKYRRQNLTHEVAQRIADVAVDTSFARARTMLLLSAAKAVAMLAVYGLFASLAFMTA